MGLIKAKTMQDTIAAKHGEKNERTETKAKFSIQFGKISHQSKVMSHLS